MKDRRTGEDPSKPVMILDRSNGLRFLIDASGDHEGRCLMTFWRDRDVKELRSIHVDHV
jgi:hypothetical protein